MRITPVLPLVLVAVAACGPRVTASSPDADRVRSSSTAAPTPTLSTPRVAVQTAGGAIVAHGDRGVLIVDRVDAKQGWRTERPSTTLTEALIVFVRDADAVEVTVELGDGGVVAAVRSRPALAEMP